MPLPVLPFMTINKLTASFGINIDVSLANVDFSNEPSWQSDNWLQSNEDGLTCNSDLLFSPPPILVHGT